MNKITIFLLVLLSGFILFQNINKPFIGHHDWNGVQYWNMARNYVRYGLTDTRLGQVVNSGITDPAEFGFNTHYFPAFPLMLAGMFRLFGSAEWSARLLPLLFSVLAAVLLYLLSKEIDKRSVGAYAALFLVVTPMFRYFGKMPVHEPVVTALAVLVVYLYLLWRNKKIKWGWFFAVSLLLQLVGWAGFYLVPLLFAYDWLKYKKPDLKSFSPFFLMSFLLILIFLLHNQILTGNVLGGGIINIVRFRLNLLTAQEASVYRFSAYEFINKELLWVRAFFTITQLSLGAVLILNLFRKKLLSTNYGLIFVLIFWGGMHALIFRNASYIHDYLLYYLGPGIALSAGFGTEVIIKKVGRKVGMFVGLLVVLASFFERSYFYKALEDTRMHQVGKDVGEEIASFSNSTEKIYVHSLSYAIIYGKFTSFYADRSIGSFNKNKSSIPVEADYEVIVKGQWLNENFDPEGLNEGQFLYWRKI